MQQNLLETLIEYLKGVGPNRGTLLRKELGIHKYGHLLNFFPNRYIDRTRYYKINELQNNVAEVQIIPSEQASAADKTHCWCINSCGLERSIRPGAHLKT